MCVCNVPKHPHSHQNRLIGFWHYQWGRIDRLDVASNKNTAKNGCHRQKAHDTVVGQLSGGRFANDRSRAVGSQRLRQQLHRRIDRHEATPVLGQYHRSRHGLGRDEPTVGKNKEQARHEQHVGQRRRIHVCNEVDWNERE